MQFTSKLAEFEASPDGFSFTISFVVIAVVAVAIAITAFAARKKKTRNESMTKNVPTSARASVRRNSDLTPEEVISKRFASTKFRGGYDQDEVDDFLDRVVVELRRLEHEKSELNHAVNNPGSVVPIRKDPLLTVEEVETVRFQPTKYREGYETSHVDEFLDEIVVSLRKLNAENGATRADLAAR